MLLPLAVSVHHAVADGYHTCKLINDIEAAAARLDRYWQLKSSQGAYGPVDIPLCIVYNST